MMKGGVSVDFHREILIATSPKRVWRALTDSHELVNWASDRVESTQHHYVLSGSSVFGGQIGGDVLERTEGQTLRFQWTLRGAITDVTIRVLPAPQTGQPSGNFSRVTVDHRNVPEDFSPPKESSYPHESLQVSWVLWLRHLALWAERAVVTGRFNYSDPLSAIVEKSVIVEADLDFVWRYLVEPDLRQKWFGEPLGAEVSRIELNQVTFEWIQDSAGTVTFHVEPMVNQRTMVLVRHEGLDPKVRFDYHLGWQDYLVSLVRTAALPLIRQTVWIETSPEHVWAWFTSEAAMQEWWNPSTVYEPKVGGRISFSDHGTHLHGLVTELTPPSRFAFTFVESGTEGVRDPFVVTLDLAPEQNGTRVYITQSGFDKLPEDIRERVFVAYQRGWADSPELDRLATVSVSEITLEGI